MGDPVLLLWVAGVALVSLLPVATFKGRAPRLTFLALAFINTLAFAAILMPGPRDIEGFALVEPFVMVILTTVVLVLAGIAACVVRVATWFVHHLQHAA